MVLLHTRVYTQIPPTKITLHQNDFNGEFYQIFKKEIMQSIRNFFQKIEDEEGTLNSLWYYHFPVPKFEIFCGNYRSIYLMIMSTKILNKILENQSSYTIDLIICECHLCEFIFLLKFASNSLINRRSRKSWVSW